MQKKNAFKLIFLLYEGQLFKKIINKNFVVV